MSEPSLRVLGVDVTDITMAEALDHVERLMNGPRDRAHSVFFVNAHSLNVAAEDAEYRRLLGEADFVFGDGTGVRWAARLLHGREPVDNVNGTDMTPELLTSRGGYRFYMLGGTEDMIARAAQHAREAFSGWTLAGHHHGYVTEDDDERVVELINATEPHLLLVGMGNPIQERWIARNQARLRVPVCMAIGGLFAYWAGDLDRAPAAMRAAGYEWLHLLRRQPRKFRRYVFGNPRFLLRVAASKLQGADAR